MLQRRHASLFQQLVGRVRSCQSIAATAQTRIAIVGSGPAGFYTAKYLLEKNPAVHVDLIEKLPVPYGLVRYGVAPDHPEVKSVQETFAKVAANERFRFFGNVELEEAAVAAGDDGAAATWSSGGGDNEDTTTTATGTNNSNKSLVNKVTLRELTKYYQGGVVLACGAENDRRLGLEHEEDCGGVHSARSFVNWYNGHPDYVHVGETIDLSSTEDVVIVGQGNVAVDCARILTKCPDELAESDICDHALAKLRNSAVKRVHVVGRRGAAQAAFTIKELRELTRLSGVTVEISADDLTASMTEASAEEVAGSRPRSRIMDLMKETSTAAAAAVAAGGGSADKHIHLRFLLQPLALETRQEQHEGGEVLPFPLDVSRRVQLDVTTLDSTSVGAKVFEPKKVRSLTGVTFGATALTGPAGSQQATLLNTTTTIPAQMLLKSVGYESVRLRGVPFDSTRHVVPHVRILILYLFLLFLFVITACLHSLTPHGTSLTIIPFSINHYSMQYSHY
jgi:adrenodoxin-NADP+ reductase